MPRQSELVAVFSTDGLLRGVRNIPGMGITYADPKTGEHITDPIKIARLGNCVFRYVVNDVVGIVTDDKSFISRELKALGL